MRLLAIAIVTTVYVSSGLTQEDVFRSHWMFTATAVDSVNPVACFPRHGEVVSAEAYVLSELLPFTVQSRGTLVSLVHEGQTILENEYIRDHSSLTVGAVSVTVDDVSYSFLNNEFAPQTLVDDDCTLIFQIDDWTVMPLDVVGDSNLDGVFDSSDLVTIFIAAKYETDETASWADGDWDFSGKFDTQDVIYAFREDTYVREAIPVPEPTFGRLTMLLLGCSVALRKRRRS